MPRVLFDHIQLQGSAGFIARTQAALVCLRTAPCHAEVWGALGVLRKAKRSGVDACQGVPLIDFGKKTWTSPTIWYASGIGHEGFHIKLYREAKLGSGRHWSDANTIGAIKEAVEEEKKCLEFQLRVLLELNAEDWYLEHVREGIKSPDYLGDPFSLKDYLRRNW
jgi:hypothetical protein